ncbi:VOC family protein [Amycolatopsis sp. NPDC051903]|uniref:VOC family protein n=1 Tax=Amycolatopsis sp. NPDC051903 TaxID=3363936 RepID=UPI00378E05B4
MNFASVRLITDDVDRLVTFYELVTGTPATWSTPDFAEVCFPSATLAIGSTRTVALFAPGSAAPASNRSAILEFLVADVDTRHEFLRGHLSDVVTPPTTMPWGNRAFLFRDPDGNLVNLFTPVTEEAVAKFAAVPR